MKKTIVILLTLILLFSSIASASFFGDGFKFITGAAIEDVAGVQEGETPVEDAPVQEPAVEPEPTTPVPEPATEPVPSTEPTPWTEPVPSTEPTPGTDQPSQEPQCWEGDKQVPCPGSNIKPPQNYQKQKQDFYQNNICWEGDKQVPCQNNGNQPQQNNQPMNNQPQVGSGDYNKQLYGESWCTNGMCCPDGVCDDFEKSSSGCPADCQPGLAQKYQNYAQKQIEGCMNSENLDKLAQKCQEKGGIANKKEDGNSGCVRMDCSFGGNQGMFVSDVCLTKEESAQQSNACTEMGLNTIVIPGKEGCAPRVQCKNEGSSTGYGLSKDEYDTGKQSFEEGNLDSATILGIIMKLDSTKMKISGIQSEMLNIADYYESEGNIERAEAYRQASVKMDDLNTKMDERMVELKTAVESDSLDWDTIYRIKTELKYSVDGPLNEAVGILLGVDSVNIKSETSLDCGQDGMCFENGFRECTEGSKFSPENGVEVKIVGIDENGYCELSIDTPMGVISCNVPDFSYATLSKESLIPYCDEGLQQISEPTSSGNTQEPMLNQQQYMIPQETTATNVIEGGVGGKEFYCDVSSVCDCNEICDQTWEDIYACDDCLRFAQCGDGLCEPLIGEDIPDNANYCQKDCTESSGGGEGVVVENVVA